MRVVLACLACITACGFQSGAGPGDAQIDTVPPDAVVSDAQLPDAPIDAPIDAPVDAPPLVRVREGLIGLWTFDEAPGTRVTTTAGDTSPTGDPVPLKVSFGTVTFADGALTPDGVAVIASDPAPHLNADVVNGGGVTLEAWITTPDDDQGTVTAPVLIAGLSASIMSRNISLLQVGKRWVARVRTTADKNGKPDLTSTTDIVANRLTHVVVVADATQRILYVDSQPVFVDPVAGPPLAWDAAYRMLLGNEFVRGRQWAGSFALVAIYNRALPKPLIDTNFKVGANGP
ncbi:MAG: LamG domain-containing protein [Myxococcales bacterium]|nr:LamG domain-containing protein [Myxococcales bacterium]